MFAIVSFSTEEEWIFARDGPNTEAGTSSSPSSSLVDDDVFDDDDALDTTTRVDDDGLFIRTNGKSETSCMYDIKSAKGTTT